MKNLKNFLVETVHRAKNDSPKYWLQLRKFWVWVTSIAAVILGLNVSEINILKSIMPKAIANNVAEISKYAVAIGVIAGWQTKLAVKSPPNPPDPEISTK